MGLSEDKSILMGQKDGTGSYVYYYPITRDSEIIMSRESNGDTLEEFADLMTGGYARDNTKLPLTGGTVTGNLVLQKGYNILHNEAAQGTAGYAKVATFTITGNYINSPISITFTRRGDNYPTTLYIYFANSDSFDPALESFKYSGCTDVAWMHKSASSTWDLYIQKPGLYTYIDIISYDTSSLINRFVNVTWVTDSLVTELPSGAVQTTALPALPHNHDNTYLKLAGGTVTGNLILQKGYVVHHSNAGSGQNGYVKVADFTITGQYINSPITIAFVRRGSIVPTKLHILFSSTNTTDPAVGYFYYDGDCPKAWLYKISESTWNLYIAKAEPYDYIEILDVQMPEYADARLTYTWTNVFAQTLPDESRQAVALPGYNNYDDTYLKLTGGTTTGPITMTRGHDVSWTTGGSDSAGYAKVATFKIKTGYINYPISIKFTNRFNPSMTTLNILFKNDLSNDPDLDSFTWYGYTDQSWIHKSDTSTWDLYIYKAAYDMVNIMDILMTPKVNKYFDVTWVTNSLVANLPSGAIQCTLTGKVLDSTNSTNSANVNLTQSATDVSSHVWFSNGTTETARNADDDLTYNPSTNTLNVKSVKMDSAKWQFNSNTNSLDLVFV